MFDLGLENRDGGLEFAVLVPKLRQGVTGNSLGLSGPVPIQLSTAVEVDVRILVVLGFEFGQPEKYPGAGEIGIGCQRIL